MIGRLAKGVGDLGLDPLFQFWDHFGPDPHGHNFLIVDKDIQTTYG